SDLLAGLSKQEGDAVLNAVHNACHASILYRCSLYTRSLASAFREPACQRRARSNLRWESPEELLLTIGRRPRGSHARLPLDDRSSPKSGSPSAVLLCRKRAKSCHALFRPVAWLM